MKNSHESSWIILTPLIILSFSSIFIGYFLKELFLGSNVDT
jgi:NADH:ubiquinone oxidoreductase subunit 5 (subunit L)/multisubunit Na+/H+ antiporter MnhA subunit